MYRETLPEFEYVLTPDERSAAAIATVQLEASRRLRNAADRRAQREADARALERALEPYE